MADKNELGGFKEIQDCCGRLGLPTSAASVLDMINFQGLPAKKIGGVWISDSELIAKWRKDYIEGVPMAENLADKPPDKVQKKGKR
jgi:hypothetical protein